MTLLPFGLEYHFISSVGSKKIKGSCLFRGSVTKGEICESLPKKKHICCKSGACKISSNMLTQRGEIKDGTRMFFYCVGRWLLECSSLHVGAQIRKLRSDRSLAIEAITSARRRHRDEPAEFFPGCTRRFPCSSNSPAQISAGLTPRRIGSGDGAPSESQT